MSLLTILSGVCISFMPLAAPVRLVPPVTTVSKSPWFNSGRVPTIGRLPACCAGLQDGKTFNPDLLGEEYVDHEQDEQEQEQEQPAADQEQQQAAQGTKQQQQRQQARQETLQRKVDRGQTTLTFMGYDRAVLEQLPKFVQQQVPFLTTAKGALDARLMEFTSSLAASNVSFANITNRLEELAYTHYYRRQLTYYSYAKEMEAAAVAARGKAHVCCKKQQQCTEYLCRHAMRGFSNMRCIDASSIAHCWSKWITV